MGEQEFSVTDASPAEMFLPRIRNTRYVICSQIMPMQLINYINALNVCAWHL